MNLKSIEQLIETTAKLRSPEGCPWDREQTHNSLKKYFVEEVYEVLEAIDKDATADLMEELGDVLFQICLHAQIESEKGNFDFTQVAETVNQKMISRHPHVFGENSQILNDSDQVIHQWEAIKAKEKAQKDNEKNTSPFSNIPSSLPSLARAVKVLKKADKLNLSQSVELESQPIFDFNNEDQLGEFLLKITNQAKIYKLDPEEALRKAIIKIQKQFESKFEKQYIHQN